MRWPSSAGPRSSFVPYLAVMRAIVGRPFGLLLAAAFPVVFTNTLVGQNGFLTASLIGGTLYLMPLRPVLAGICLGLLSYKPQYGLLFPLVLIAASQWRCSSPPASSRSLMALASWLAFGTESWQAFVHWMPMFSQAFLTEGRAPWGKMQSIFGLVRYFGGPEQLAWVLQWIMSGTVAVLLALMWRSRIRYSLKAAALAAGTLLMTPYLFLYDVMVLAIAVAFLVRIGLKQGFQRHELPALGWPLALMFFPLLGAPTGFAATLIVTGLIAVAAGFGATARCCSPAPPHRLERWTFPPRQYPEGSRYAAGVPSAEHGALIPTITQGSANPKIMALALCAAVASALAVPADPGRRVRCHVDRRRHAAGRGP